MRSDMGRVVTERPRRGSRGASSAKARFYGKIVEQDGELEYEGLSRLPVSKRQSYLHPKIGEKDFSDLLGPIQKWLRSRVGKPWNTSKSEAFRVLSAGSWPIRHVLYDHLLKYVDETCYLADNGKIYPQPYSKAYGDFWVDPRNGFLREDRKIWSYGTKLEQKDTDRFRIEGDRWIVKTKGLWFIGRYELKSFVPAEYQASLWSSLNSWNVTKPEWPNFIQGYRDGTWIFTKEKSASRKEIKRYAPFSLRLP